MSDKALGKGLAALVGGDDIDLLLSGKKVGKDGMMHVPLHCLYAGECQPRTVFHKESLEELAASIKQIGILQPLIVRKSDNNSYEIIAGERRWRAAMIAGMESVPVIVRDISDEQAMEFAIVENVQRKDLNPVEEANGYKRLVDQFSYTHERISIATGKSRSHISNMLRILSLPESVLAMLSDGTITFGHVRAIVGRSDAQEIAEKIKSSGLTVRQVEAMIKNDNQSHVESNIDNCNAPVSDQNVIAKNRSGDSPKKYANKKNPVNNELLEIASVISEFTKMETEITSNRVIMHYTDMSQLDDLLEAITSIKKN